MPTRVFSRYIVLVLIFVTVIAALGRDRQENLAARARQIFGPLPSVMTSAKNAITPEKTRLGKMLFYETRISADGTVSCSRCHPLSLYGADGLRKSIGVQLRISLRNAPSVLNAAAQIAEHWVGNRADVEDQAAQSLLGVPSFGLPSGASAEEKLKSIPGYADLFKAAFPSGGDPLTAENFGKAVGAFERTLVTPAPFDAFMDGDSSALNDREKNGLRTFMDGGCTGCHFSPYLGGQIYQKFGLVEEYWKFTKSDPVDGGRITVTKNDADRYFFKVPPLRNVAETSPYFHDGSVDDLSEAVRIMGKTQLGRDLAKEQIGDITAFFQSLTGKIPEDALRLPVLPSSR